MANILIVTHNAGFFSCCSVRLDKIIDFFNTHKQLPEKVDSSAQFLWYKPFSRSGDLTDEYFDLPTNYNNIEFTNIVDYNESYQFVNYSNINYFALSPFVKKYFSPSATICQMMIHMQKKYAIDFENTCVLFYRGNDKSTETNLSSYDEYVSFGKVCLLKNPQIMFLIQSDETEFIKKMCLEFPNNSFFMKDEIRHMTRRINTVDFLMKNNIDIYSKQYLAITILMSKCKYVVCGSGNCSIWIMLYRGHNKNVYQYLHNRWLLS